MKMLIKGGRIIDPANNLDMKGDILIQDGTIREIADSIDEQGTQVLNAEGKIVCPGFIDLHVHFREPGMEYKETIESGSRAAAVGGFTTVCCMPNTSPVCDNRAVASFVAETAKRSAVVNVRPIGSITKGQKGQEITEILALAEAGCVAISDDGKPVMNAEVMRRALEYSSMIGLTVIAHCEDLNLAEDGQMHEGYYSTLYGLKGIPAEAEEVMAARDIQMVKMTGGKLHVAHLSTAGSLELVRGAKARGASVTCEVTPHHISLTDAMLLDYDTNLKVNPPLRSQAHVEALIGGLRDGSVDCMATDHAPHDLESKDCEFNLAAFGISGLETAIPVTMEYLVHRAGLDLAKAVRVWTSGPAAVLGLDRGTLSPGKPADITIIDMDLEREVDPAGFESKGRNNPYRGMKLKGWPVATLVGGKLVAKDGRIL